MQKRFWSFVNGFFKMVPSWSIRRVDRKCTALSEAKGFRDTVGDAIKFDYPIVLTVGTEGEEFLMVVPAGHSMIELVYNMAAGRVYELQAVDFGSRNPEVVGVSV